MIVRFMYILPMILGRTYDMTKNLVGVDIFPSEYVESPKIRPQPFFDSRHKIIETVSDIKDVLSINGDLSLGVKAGLFAFRGAGSYIKESLNAQNFVDILTRVTFTTVAKELPGTAKPVATWLSMGKKYLGTHYVHSVIYGGDLIACIRFKAVKHEYLDDIRALVKTSLGKGNIFDLDGEGKLETLNKNLGRKATMEINYYATVSLEGVPHTLEGLRNLINNFEEHVKKEENGIGVPVAVELEELSVFDKGFSFIKNIDLEIELKFFEEYLNDLLKTKSNLKAWLANLPGVLSKEQEKKVSEFSERLSSVLNKFIDTIANLNLEKDSSQLSKAKSAYEGKGGIAVAKFSRELRKLESKIALSRKTQIKGSVVYTHYGASDCGKDNSTSTIFSGYLTSSPRKMKGAAYNYLCFPKLSKRFDQEELVGYTSKIAGVKYGLLSTKPFQINENDTVFKGVTCSVCLVKQRPNVHTFLGQSKCPEESDWVLQYSGFIMSSIDATRSEHICVDSAHKSHVESDPGYDDHSISFVLALQDNEYKFVPCAVCSK